MFRITMCLAGVCIALIVVGVVSNTLARHLIQIFPVVMVLAAAFTGRKWMVLAAFPLFVFWLVIMVFIWLYLLKIAAITRGHFTIPEISLTIVIGICCVYGIVLTLAQLSTSRLTNIAFIVWNLVVGFSLIFFFNTLSHAMPGYRRNLQLSMTLFVGLGISLLVYFLRHRFPVFKGHNILAVFVMMALQAGALTLSYL